MNRGWTQIRKTVGLVGRNDPKACAQRLCRILQVPLKSQEKKQRSVHGAVPIGEFPSFLLELCRESDSVGAMAPEPRQHPSCLTKGDGYSWLYTKVSFL